MKVKNRDRLVLGIVFGMLSFMAVPVSARASGLTSGYIW